MTMTIRPVSYSPNYKGIREDISENSGKIAIGGATGTAAFSTMRNSTKIANKMTRIVNESSKLTKANQAKLAKIFSKVKWLNNPVMRKFTGPLAAFSALSAVVGSTVKIADTCNFFTHQN